MIPQYKGSYNIPSYSDSGNAAGAIGDFLTNIANLSSENKEKKKQSDIEAFKQNLQLRQQQDNEQRNSVLNDYQTRLGMQLESAMAEKQATKFDIENVIAGGSPTTESGINLYAKMKTRTPDARPTMQNGVLVQGYTDWSGNRTYDKVQQPKADVRNLNPYLDTDGQWKQNVYTDGKVTDTQLVANPNTKSSGTTYTKDEAIQKASADYLKSNYGFTKDMFSDPDVKNQILTSANAYMSGKTVEPVPFSAKYGNTYYKTGDIVKEGNYEYQMKPYKKEDGTVTLGKFPSGNNISYTGDFKDYYNSIAKKSPSIAKKIEDADENGGIDGMNGQKFFLLLHEGTDGNIDAINKKFTSVVNKEATRQGGFGSFLATTFGGLNPFEYNDSDLGKYNTVKRIVLSNMLQQGFLKFDKSKGIDSDGLYPFIMIDPRTNRPIPKDKKKEDELIQRLMKNQKDANFLAGTIEMGDNKELEKKSATKEFLDFMRTKHPEVDKRRLGDINSRNMRPFKYEFYKQQGE